MATNVTTVGSKSSRYLKASNELNTISREWQGKVADVQSTVGLFTGLGDAARGAGGALVSSGIATTVGGWLEVAGSIWNGLVSGIGGYVIKNRQKKADASANASKYMAEYANALTERDSLISSTMRQLDTGRQNMRDQYGSEFESMVYNLYLAQNGITPTTYSLMTGNFNTFENIGYGSTSTPVNRTVNFGLGLEYPTNKEYELDSLTYGDNNTFQNMYRSINSGDLKPIIDNLVKALYSSDSTVGMQLKAYEVEARQVLEAGLEAQNEALIDAQGNLNASALNKQQENISATEQMGSAQAGRATSGMRGGTATNNEKLVQLQKDLNEMKGIAQASIVMRSLQNSIKKIQTNTAYSVLTNRLNQKAMIQQANANATANVSAMGATVAETEHQSNLGIESAKIYGKEIENYRREYRSDYDRMVSAMSK